MYLNKREKQLHVSTLLGQMGTLALTREITPSLSNTIRSQGNNCIDHTNNSTLSTLLGQMENLH